MTQNTLIVAGISGGADSLCLLGILHNLGFPLVAAHFDHQLRDNSRDDELSVRRIAKGLNIEYVHSSSSVKEYAEKKRLSIEESARILRYRFLFETARQVKAGAVAVGHTADDQVETVLQHLIRGAGLPGLKGMEYYSVNPLWDQTLPLIRPLLGIWHEETEAYCKHHDLPFIIDQSNFDRTYQRNRLRHDLIPLLETYNPQFRQVIWSTTQVLNEDYQVVYHAVEQAWQRVIVRVNENRVVLSRDQFLNELIGIQRSLLRKAIAYIHTNGRDVTLEAIERGRTFIQTPSHSRQTNLIGKLNLCVRGNEIYIFPWGKVIDDTTVQYLPQVQSGHEDPGIELTIPGEIELGNGWRISAETEVYQVEQPINPNIDEAYLDFETLSSPLRVRCQRPGDRFQPLGLSRGKQKLSNFFINEKLGVHARAKWPLVCSGEEIAWVAGYRIGHPFRLTSKSRAMVRLRLFRELP